jgi:cytidylate kinase
MPRLIDQIVDEQVKKWEIRLAKEKEEAKVPLVITVSREPGSGGLLVAKGLAEKLGLDFFHREIIQEMAQSANISARVVETLDEKKFTTLDDWTSALVHERHLWPDEYLHHLMQVIGTMGKHGNCVIVGRGANFIVPPEGRFRIRIVAPIKDRIKHVAEEFDVDSEEARRHVLRKEANRNAFVRKYFHEDVTSPSNYDLVINTGTVSIEAVIETIKCTLIQTNLWCPPR